MLKQTKGAHMQHETMTHTRTVLFLH